MLICSTPGLKGIVAGNRITFNLILLIPETDLQNLQPPELILKVGWNKPASSYQLQYPAAHIPPTSEKTNQRTQYLNRDTSQPLRFHRQIMT
jgi:hypothetical protein